MIMKKLFISVCIIASIYLMAQTSFAKNLISKVLPSQDANYQIMQNKLDTLNKTILEVNTSNERANLALLSRLEIVEKSLSAMSNATKLSGNDPTNTVQSSEMIDSVSDDKFAAVASTTVQSGPAIEHKSEMVSPRAEMTQQTIEKSDSKKRLQQQAALRDLTQRLELLALDTLSNK